MNNVEEMLAYKRQKIMRELLEAKEAATEVKLWSAIAQQHAINTLNHIRDLELCIQTMERAFKEEVAKHAQAKTST